MKQRNTITQSVVRFFDTRYEYSVYFKNISVTNDSSYRIGLTKEASADYLGYQTSKVEDGKFDIRLLSSLSSSSYDETGYTVYRLTGKGDRVTSVEDVITSTNIYQSIRATAADGRAPPTSARNTFRLSPFAASLPIRACISSFAPTL